MKSIKFKNLSGQRGQERVVYSGSLDRTGKRARQSTKCVTISPCGPGRCIPRSEAVALRQLCQPVCPSRQRYRGCDDLCIPAYHRGKGAGLRQQSPRIATRIAIDPQPHLPRCPCHVEAQALDRPALRHAYLLGDQKTPSPSILCPQNVRFSHPKFIRQCCARRRR
jgi:hypothetical protein